MMDYTDMFQEYANIMSIKYCSTNDDSEKQMILNEFENYKASLILELEAKLFLNKFLLNKNKK